MPAGQISTHSEPPEFKKYPLRHFRQRDGSKHISQFYTHESEQLIVCSLLTEPAGHYAEQTPSSFKYIFSSRSRHCSQDPSRLYAEQRGLFQRHYLLSTSLTAFSSLHFLTH